MNLKTRFVKAFLCIALMVAMALMAVGCSGGNSEKGPESSAAVIQTDGETLGTGSVSFQLSVTDGDGGEIHAEIHTDKETVGEALKELDLIAGEESATGLYVKVVNGIMADYDVDGTYWAFYVDGERAQTGVDSTSVSEGTEYAFAVEKG